MRMLDRERKQEDTHIDILGEIIIVNIVLMVRILTISRKNNRRKKKEEELNFR